MKQEEIQNHSNFYSKVATKLLYIWLISIIIGFILLFFVLYAWFFVFNLLFLICIFLMIMPMAQIIISMREYKEKKEWKKPEDFIRSIIWIYVISFCTSLIIVYIFFPNISLQGFFIVGTILMFVQIMTTSIVLFIIIGLYSYFGEA